MPAPSQVPGVVGFGIGFDPRRLPVDPKAGGSGGMRGPGLVPKRIRGVSIAFGSAHNAEVPLWQPLDELGR